MLRISSRSRCPIVDRFEQVDAHEKIEDAEYERDQKIPPAVQILKHCEAQKQEAQEDARRAN